MAIYEYRCEGDGPFLATFPMGQAPGSIPCRACGVPARRVFSSPQLAFTSEQSRQVVSAMEHSERTAERPDVVTSVPAGTRRARRPPTVPLTPALQGLPRP